MKDKLFFVILALFFMVCLLNYAFALPEGEQVESGNVVFERPDDHTLNVTAGDKSVINFTSFNISSNETVNFIQPTSSAAVLSRVTGPDPSSICGSLTANGCLFLVNPHGIAFGPTANVTVNTLVCSTLDISTQNFIDANYTFQHLQGAPYSPVVNEGDIRGNFVVLMGSAVRNSGIIQAHAGRVHLVSGDKATVSFDPKGLVQVVVDEETSGKVVDASGTSMKDAVSSSGTIEAGQVFMSVKTAGDIFENAVNHTGVVKATGLAEENGVIKVVANKNIQVSGRLESHTIEVKSADSVRVDAALTTKGDAAISADNNIVITKDITTEDSDIHLFADRDGNGLGEFRQLDGTIYATGPGNVTIDGSGEMTLGTIKTDSGSIQVGVQRAPSSIAGNPHYIHTKGDFEIVQKEEGTDVTTLKTSRGDVLKYNTRSNLTLEAQSGRIADITPTPLSSLYLTLIGNEFFVNSSSATTHIFKNNGDIYISDASNAGEAIVLEGEGFGAVTYLKANNITLQTDNDVTTNPGVVIQAHEVKVIGRKIGSADNPLTIDASRIHIKRLYGNIDIMESLGIGTSVLIRGPPDGFGAIIYNSDSLLILEAEGVSVPTSAPVYFYGDITFYNFECTIPAKEIYFQAGKTYTFKGTFHIEGQPGGYPVYLASSVPGEPWYISVEPSEYQIITVAVGDSHNIGEMPIIGSPSLNKGNNAGWDLNTVYWLADIAGNWNTAGNWNPGVPGASDAVVFNSSHVGSCNIDTPASVASVDIQTGYSGTITINAGQSLTTSGTLTLASATAVFDSNGQTLTVDTYTQTAGTFNAGASNITCNGTYTGDFSVTGGTFNANTSTINVKGTVDLRGGTFNAGSSTLKMIGDYWDLGIIYGNSHTFNNLWISAANVWIYQNISISGTLTIDADHELDIYYATVTMTAGSTTTVNGTVKDKNGGMLELVDSAGANLSTGGIIACKVRFTTATSDVTVPARTYSDTVEFYNNTTTSYKAILGTAAVPTQTLTFGNFYPMAQSTGNMTIDAATNSPNVNITQNLDFKGEGGGTEILLMGSGTWTTNGNVDFTGGTVTAGGSTLAMDSSSWAALGSGIGNSSVYALTVFNGKLIVGGSFTQAGGASANYIAQWDGTSWSTFGSGMGGIVRCLTVYNSNLIAGGEFTTAGGGSAPYIAQWNGTSWSSLGSGMGDIVFALAVNGGNLIAGGNFTTAGGVSANRVASWNGTSWSAMSTGMNGSVYSLTVYSGNVIAGGLFTTASGNTVNYIAKWDGASWSALGGGMSNGSVWALAVYSGNLIAGGLFAQAGGVTSNNIASWNGAAWSAMSTGTDGTVEALAVYNDDLTAGGYFTKAGGVSVNYIAKWDGSSWSSIGGGTNSYVHALTIYNSDQLIAGGGFTTAGGNAANRVAARTNATLTTANQPLNNVTVKNTASFDQGIVVSGNLTVNGDLNLQTTRAGDIALDCSTNNPTVTVVGDLISSGTATVSGDFPVSDLTVQSGSLTLEAGSSCTVDDAGTVTVNPGTILNLSGTGADDMVVLQSDNPGTQFDLTNNGTVNATWTSVQDCSASAAITVTNGTDAGNNSANVTCNPENRYWIAGSSQVWNDTTYWSKTSGGSSGASVPGASNNVVFDSHGLGSCGIDIPASVSAFTIESGYTTGTVTINSGQSLATSGSFTLDGGNFNSNGQALTVASYSQTGGAFTAGASTITCSGGYAITGGTYTANTSNLVLNGSSQQTLTGGGKTFSTITISNSSANGVLMNSNLTCTTLTINGGSVFQMDGTSSAVTLTFANGGTLANSGAFKVYNDTNNCTVTSTGTFTFTGTEPDYNANTLRLGKCDLQMDTTIGSGEKLEIIANCTVDGVTVNSGGEFACTTDGVTITGDSSKDIAVYSGGTLTFNPSTYVTGITATGMHSLYVENGTININHLTASSGNSYTLSLNGSGLTVTNLTNSTFTNNVTQTFSAIYVAGYANVTATYCNFNSNGGGYGAYMYFFGTLNATNCNFNSPDGAAAGVFFFGTLNATGCTFNGKDGAYWGADIYNKDLGKAYLTDCTFNTVSFFHQDYAGYPIISKNTTDKTWDMWGTFSSSEPAAGWKGSDIPSDYVASYKETDYTYYEGDTTFTMDENISCKSLNIDSDTTWQLNASTPTQTVTLSLDGSAGGTLTNNGTITDGGLTATHYAEIVSSDATDIAVNGGAVVADTSLIRIRDATISDTDNTGSGTINAWGCTEGSGNSGNRDFGALGTSFNDVANGNWNDGATWGHTSPGVEGVDYPGLTDEVTIDSHTVAVVNNNTKSGDITIGSSGTLRLNGSAGAATLTVRANGIVSNSGVIQVQDSTNACTIQANSGIAYASGTEWDYNSRTLNISGLDVGFDTALGSSEKLAIAGNCTIDGVTVNSGGEFSCTTDGVAITGNASKDITLNSGGTLRFNPSSYSSGITVTGYNCISITGGTIDFNHLTATSADNYGIYINGSPTVTNFTNSHFTGSGSYNAMYVTGGAGSYFAVSNCTFTSSSYSSVWVNNAYFKATGCTFSGEDGGNYDDEDLCFGCAGSSRIELTDCTFTTVGISNEGYADSFIIHKNTATKTWDMWGNFASSLPESGFKGSDIPSDYTVTLQKADAVSTGGGTFTQDENISCKSLVIDSGKTWQINKSSPTAAVTLSLDGSAGGTLTNNGSITFGTLTAANKATITSSDTTKVVWSGATPTWTSYVHLGYVDFKTNSLSFTTGANAIYIDNPCDFFHVTISNSGTLDDSSNSNFSVGGAWNNSGTGSFISGTSTVTFDVANSSNITTGGTGDTKDFYGFTLNKPGGGIAVITDGLDIDGPLIVTAGILHASQNVYANGSTSIDTNGTIRLDGITWTQGNGTTLSNSGVFQVYSDATASILTSGGTFTYTGTEPDYNGKTLRLGNCDLQTNTTIGNNEGLILVGPMTMDGVTLASGGSFDTGGYSLILTSYSQTGGAFTGGASTITCSGDYSVTGGTYNGNSSSLVLDATNGDILFTGGGYTFNNVTFRNNSTVSARTIRLSAGTFGFNGDFCLEAANTRNITVDAATNNPTLNISGKVDYIGGGTGSESISMGNGTWTVGGNVDFTGGTVTAGGSTLKLNGSSGQTITSNGQSLNAITVTNASAGGVTFADRLQCASLTDTTQASKLSFSSASLALPHSVSTTLTLTGGSGGTMITLAPQVPLTTWYLSPPAGTTVTGVDVSYSHSDKAIAATSSHDGGNNTLWSFGSGPVNPPAEDNVISSNVLLTREAESISFQFFLSTKSSKGLFLNGFEPLSWSPRKALAQ